MKKNTRATLFNVETLEPRILLSADPIVGELVQQYHNANTENLGVLQVAAPTATENALLKQSSQENAPPNTLKLNLADLKNQNYALNTIDVQNFADFKNAAGQIVIGNAQSNALIHIGDVKTADGALSFNSNLLISNPQLGGEIFIDDNLVGGNNANLTINGSGHTTTLSADLSTVNTNITVNDSLKISGVGAIGNIRSITAGTAGMGSIQLGSASNHTLDGDSIAGDDKLTLTAGSGGNIIVKGIVGGTDPLEELKITAANNVTFDSEITVNGDVTITATGTVTFSGALNITNGNLTINGASLIVFGNNVVVGTGKNIFLEANEITFNGGQESVRGTGTLTMRPTILSNDIAIASPPSENTSDTLNLSSSELVTLGDGFSKITIGRENTVTNHADSSATGTIYVGSKAANQNTFTDALEIFGKNIEIKDYSNPDFKFQNKDTIKLDALENILIYNEIKALDGTTNKNVTLYSVGGEIKQISNDSDVLVTESIGAADLTITSSKGIDLSWVNAVNVAATNTTSGNIKINSNAPVAVTTTFTAITGVPTSSIALSSDLNNLVLNTPLTTSSGAITLNSGGTFIISQTISTASGAIDIKSKNDLTLNAMISTTGSSPIKLESIVGSILQNVDVTSVQAGGLIMLTAGANITMLDGKQISTGTTANGTIILKAGSDIKLSFLDATAIVNVEATAGAIIDNLTGEAPNIKGGSTDVTLKATKGMGASTNDINTFIAKLTAINDATAASGGIFITEIDGLTVSNGGIKSSGSDGSVIILNGSTLSVEGSIDVMGTTGNILLQNAGDTTLKGRVSSANGNISIISAGALTHTDAGDIEITTDATKTIELEAALAITMVDGTIIKTKGGNVRLNAKNGDIKLGGINALTGSVSLLTTNTFNIVDGGDSDLDIVAGNLRITTLGAGLSTTTLEVNALEINVTNLSAAIGSSGVFLSEVDSVIVTQIPAVAVNHVGMTAATTSVSDFAVQSDIKTTANGAIVLTTETGDITLEKPVTSGGSGNLLLKAKGALTIKAPVTGGAGSNVSLISGSTVTQTADGDIATSGTGTIDVNAAIAIVMADGATTKTENRDLRYKTITGDITLGSIDVGTASIAVLAGGSILDADTTAIDIHAKAINLTAGNGIGIGDNPLEISVDNLTAKAGAGGVFITETDAVNVEQVNVSVNLVSTTGLSSIDATVTSSDLSTIANGAIVLNATDITLKDSDNNNKAIDVNGSGNILLNAAAGNIMLLSSINSSSGNISLIANQNINQSNASHIITGGTGTIDLMASSTITMANGVKTQTANGNIRLNAITSDITVGQINAGTGNVSLITGGRVVDGNDTGNDIVASGLRLNAMTGVGKMDNALDIHVMTLSGIVSNGSFFISDATGITVTTIDTFSVNRVDSKAAVIPVIDAAQSDLISASNGSIVLTTLAGDIIVLDGNTDGKGIFTTSTGNILLNSAGGISVQTDINANGGNVTLLSRGSITQGSVGSITTVAQGTIDLSAAIAINLATGAKIQTAGGNIRLNAVESMTLSGVNATTGSVSLSANSILGSDGNNALDITATNLRINAIGVGTSTHALDISVDNLSAVITNGGLFINEADGITVTEISAIVVKRVATTGLITDITDLKQSDLTSLSGAIVLTTQAGDITVLDGNSDTKGITTQSGNILLNAAANLSIRTTIENRAGSMSLMSGATLTQTATGYLTAAGFGTIDVSAATAIVMAEGVTTKTINQDIRYKTTTGDITVSSINAGTANIALLAGGSIIDVDTTATDIIAAGINLTANNAIGSGTNPLEIATSKFTASSSSGGIFIVDTEAVNVDQVNVAVQQVNSAGISIIDTTLTASDLMTANGAIVLTAPKITVNDGDTNNKGVTSTGLGNILLNATAGNLELKVSVSGGGNLSLLSSAGIKQSPASTISTREKGTIELNAGADITMLEGAKIQAAAGNVRLSTTGNINVGSIITGANVSLIANKILNNGDNHNITANALRINANSAGLNNNVLDTNINNLSAIISTGGLFITEENAVTITEIPVLTVNCVAADASVSIITDAKQSDVINQSGAIILTTLVGDITILDGNNNGKSVIATTGHILLNAAGSIVIQADIDAKVGSISLLAGANVTQSATGNLTTVGKGTIEITAGEAITMSNGAITKTTNKDIRYQTNTGDITLAQLNAGRGNVAILAGRSIVGVDNVAVNVIASGVNSIAGNAIGNNTNALKIKTDRFTASAGAGGLFVNTTNTSVLIIDNVSVTVQRVTPLGTVVASNVKTGSDVKTSGNGSIIISAARITVNDGNHDFLGIVANGSGNILLNATAGSITLQAGVSSEQGAISLISTGAIKQNKLGNITTGKGSIDLSAASITSVDTVKTRTLSGNIRINAFNTLNLNQVNAGTGSVSLIATHIIDSGYARADVIALDLSMKAKTIGTKANALDVDVDRLAASATGNLFINDKDDIVITSIPIITVMRVSTNGDLIEISDEKQSGLTVVNNGSISLVATGDITLNSNVLTPLSSIKIQSTMGSIFKNATVKSSGSVQLQAAKKVTTTANSLRQIVGTVDFDFNYQSQVNNKAFHLWIETVKV